VLTGAVLDEVAAVVLGGGIIAYPAEAVFGLGCDPGDKAAVLRICRIKQRPRHAGMILIAAELDQLAGWIEPREAELARLLGDTPSSTTWIVSRGRLAGDWVTGGRDRVAVRLTRHAVAAALCLAIAGPLISTSASRRGRRPARNVLQARRWFGGCVDGLMPGPTGGESRPSIIRDARTGRRLRP
jgi:L-threonylcarbamoyladenylate synthase